MSSPLQPIRRVVTGNDAQGKSCVLFDSAAPNANPGAIRPGTGMTDIWVYHACPVPLAGGRDGLALVHRMLAQASAHLNPEGLLVVEIGHNRAALEKVYPRLPFTWLETSAGGDYVFMLHKEDLI